MQYYAKIGDLDDTIKLIERKHADIVRETTEEDRLKRFLNDVESAVMSNESKSGTITKKSTDLESAAEKLKTLIISNNTSLARIQSDMVVQQRFVKVDTNVAACVAKSMSTYWGVMKVLSADGTYRRFRQTGVGQ